MKIICQQDNSLFRQGRAEKCELAQKGTIAIRDSRSENIKVRK